MLCLGRYTIVIQYHFITTETIVELPRCKLRKDREYEDMSHMFTEMNYSGKHGLICNLLAMANSGQTYLTVFTQ